MNVDLFAGVTSGAFASLLTHPLDVIKVRLQVADGSAARAAVSYPSTAAAVRTIVANEGIRGLWKGAVPGVTGASVSWGLYFFFYERAKLRHSVGWEGPLGSQHHMLAAYEAGIMTLLFTNPIWLVKTRMQLQVSAGPSNYTGLFHGLRSVVKAEGVFGLYKGIGPALFLTSHGAVQFVAYEKLKAICRSSKIDMDARHYFVMGALSKMAASTATYPFQVVKSRLQQTLFVGPSCHPQPAYSGMVDCTLKTFRNEGVRGFFKGLVVNLYKVVPTSALTLVIYEHVRTALINLQSSSP